MNSVYQTDPVLLCILSGMWYCLEFLSCLADRYSCLASWEASHAVLLQETIWMFLQFLATMTVPIAFEKAIVEVTFGGQIVQVGFDITHRHI